MLLVTAKEAVFELVEFPVMATEAISELTVLSVGSVMVTEAGFELSELPVMAIKTVNKLSVLSVSVTPWWSPAPPALP